MKTWYVAGTVMVALSLAGCKASKPGYVEDMLITKVKQKITVGGKNRPNPAPDNEASIKEGRAHFQHHCQICHGLDGHNTGVPFAEKMDPPVADLGDEDVQEYTDGQLKWILENGIGPSGMPGWRGILDDDEMWKVVRFIRHLPAKGSQGIPDVFKEEAEEHEEMRSGAPAGKPKKGGEGKPHTHTQSHSHSH